MGADVVSGSDPEPWLCLSSTRNLKQSQALLCSELEKRSTWGDNQRQPRILLGCCQAAQESNIGERKKLKAFKGRVLSNPSQIVVEFFPGVGGGGEESGTPGWVQAIGERYGGVLSICREKEGVSRGNNFDLLLQSSLS